MRAEFRQLDDCIALLNRYSLISAADNLISIHRLVQAVIQDRLSLEEQKIWAESALKMVNDAFSFSQLDEETWEKCSKLSLMPFMPLSMPRGWRYLYRRRHIS